LTVFEAGATVDAGATRLPGCSATASLISTPSFLWSSMIDLPAEATLPESDSGTSKRSHCSACAPASRGRR
jgi:hypothetical protein